MEQQTNDTMLTVHTLGAFSVYLGGQQISSQSQRSGQVWKLFRYLISNRTKPVPTERLIDVLWPEDDDVENPIKALYSLIYRLRALLNKYNDEKVEYILFQHNSYLWNPEAPCWFDIDVFEALCKRADDASLPEKEQIDLYTRALSLYQGEYLAESSYESWVLPLSNYYKRLYTHAVSRLAGLYASAGDYASIVGVCEQAIELDPLEETLHESLIDALIHLGQLSQALAHYDYVANILHKEMGVQPSERLLALYKRIHQDTEDVQYDIAAIKQNMMENTGLLEGAFYCELNVFRQIYQLECRAMERSGQSAFICTINISDVHRRIPDNATLSAALKMLKRICLINLRHGDVVSQYSKSQVVLLLSTLTMEDCENVLKRMESKFNNAYKGVPVVLTHDMDVLEAF